MEAQQKQCQALAEQERQQEQELRDIRERLQGCQELNERGCNQLESRRPAASLQDGTSLGVELERQRNFAAEFQQEHDALREELASTEEEAKHKFWNQQEGIDMLQQDRDEALRNYNHWQTEVQQLIRATGELTAEKARLLVQKDGLVTIVEDLHQTCGIAGLALGGQEPMDSIMGFNRP